MHALEMEEVESLVGGSRKKLQQARAKLTNPKDDESCLSGIASTRSFMTNVIAVAGLALVMVAAVALFTKDGSTAAVGGDQSNHIAGADTSGLVDVGSNKSVDQASASNTRRMDAAGSTGLVYSSYAKVTPLKYTAELNDKQRTALSAKWGHWHFWDGEEDTRPKEDFAAKFANRDVPAEKFPETAWQADAVFVNHYLNDAEQLVTRAMEAIYTEYGHGKPLPDDRLAARSKMFRWDKIDMATQTNTPPGYGRGGSRGNGGWTTHRSFEGLVRRLLHAMMTQDEFVVVLGGHSAAAGQGNHFHQSYMMQFHKVMSPVFNRLGVKLVTRNMAQGGMGTGHSSLGSLSIYGDCDLLLWDTGMTEGSQVDFIDLFLRQALISGKKVPVVWGGEFSLLRNLHEEADVDVGDFGWGYDGIAAVTSKEQAKSVPWAARYLKCSSDARELCQDEPRFCATCWIDRDDGIKPEANQMPQPKGQVKWHPGWRVHQLKGRALAFSVLQALSEAVNQWSEGTMGGPPLADEKWHVTKYYNNIRKKVIDLGKNTDKGECNKLANRLPKRICWTPMRGRTQYTPRANPEVTSLSSIVKPADNGYKPTNDKKLLYEGPDAHNKCFDIQENQVDVHGVVSGRRRRHLEQDPFAQHDITPREILNPAHQTGRSQSESKHDSTASAKEEDKEEEEVEQAEITTSSHRQLEEIKPGKGWEVLGEPAGYCDGSYESTCALEASAACALYGHHDAHGDIVGNAFSGWLVLTVPKVKEGIIILKLNSWHDPKEHIMTKDWTSVNNVQARNLRENPTEVDEMLYESEISPAGAEYTDSDHRSLGWKYTPRDVPDNFEFDYAINGKITTMKKAEYMEKKKNLQGVLEALVILNDPNFTNKEIDVEVAIRIRNCGKECIVGLSHVYFA